MFASWKPIFQSWSKGYLGNIPYIYTRDFVCKLLARRRNSEASATTDCRESARIMLISLMLVQSSTGII